MNHKNKFKSRLDVSENKNLGPSLDKGPKKSD